MSVVHMQSGPSLEGSAHPYAGCSVSLRISDVPKATLMTSGADPPQRPLSTLLPNLLALVNPLSLKLKALKVRDLCTAVSLEPGQGGDSANVC